MRLRFITGALLGLALAAVALAAPQRSGAGTLGGQVTSPDGKPVAGARVLLQGSDGSKPTATETNRQGRFWFPGLAEGLYDVRAHSQGRASAWRKNITVRRGRQTNVTLRLAPARTMQRPPAAPKPAPAAGP